jgi:hypothetical protein
VRLPEAEYPSHFLTRGVSESGCIGIHHRPIFISSALAGEWLGLEEVDDDVWCVRFCSTELGRYDRRKHQFIPESSRGGPGGFAPRTPD